MTKSRWTASVHDFRFDHDHELSIIENLKADEEGTSSHYVAGLKVSPRVDGRGLEVRPVLKQVSKNTNTFGHKLHFFLGFY